MECKLESEINNYYMKFVSPFLGKSFLKSTLKLYLILFSVFFALGFICIVAVTSKYESGHRKGLYLLVNGLTTMTVNDCLYACVAGIFLACTSVLIFFIMDKPQKIVVYLDFNDALQKIHIKTRFERNNKVDESFILYAQLQVKGRYKLNNEQKKHAYEGVEIHKNHMFQGVVLENHESWSMEEFILIKRKLLSISKLG